MRRTFHIWTAVVLLGGLWGTVGAQTPSPSPAPVPTAVLQEKTPSHWVNGLLDMNRATHVELTALGLSNTAANRVIENRPYGRKGQLLRFNALTPQEFWKIEGRIYAKTSTRCF